MKVDWHGSYKAVSRKVVCYCSALLEFQRTLAVNGVVILYLSPFPQVPLSPDLRLTLLSAVLCFFHGSLLFCLSKRKVLFGADPDRKGVTWKTPSSSAFVHLQEPVAILVSYVPHTQMPV
jgi:hypothetical protein